LEQVGGHPHGALPVLPPQARDLAKRVRPPQRRQFQQHRHWHFIEPIHGDAWFNLTQVQGFDLFHNEILLIPLFGHTEGHCGIAIKTQQGWKFFCGDAYYSHLELNPQNKLRSLNALEVFFAEDNSQRLSNLHKIQQLAQSEPSIEIFCAHDPVELSHHQSLIL
jgi:glyoxylase-like metal-dependent hydrolase (beta-lactamase superfamily II)